MDRESSKNRDKLQEKVSTSSKSSSSSSSLLSCGPCGINPHRLASIVGKLSFLAHFTVPWEFVFSWGSATHFLSLYLSLALFIFFYTYIYCFISLLSIYLSIQHLRHFFLEQDYMHDTGKLDYIHICRHCCCWSMF